MLLLLLHLTLQYCEYTTNLESKKYSISHITKAFDIFVGYSIIAIVAVSLMEVSVSPKIPVTKV